jgi:hypothetical protein
MRTICLVILSGIFIGLNGSLAQAECYGDAAEAYGCGVPSQRSSGKSSRNSPSLERFGSDEAPVLPDTGYNNQGQSTSDVITPEERYKMLRGIVLGRGGATRSRTIQMQAVNSAGRPLRRSGSLPARTR